MKRSDMCNSSPREKKRDEDERHIAKNFPKQIKPQTTNYSISPRKPSWLVTKREKKSQERENLKRCKGMELDIHITVKELTKKTESQYLTGIMDTTYNVVKENNWKPRIL